MKGKRRANLRPAAHTKRNIRDHPNSPNPPTGQTHLRPQRILRRLSGASGRATVNPNASPISRRYPISRHRQARRGYPIESTCLSRPSATQPTHLAQAPAFSILTNAGYYPQAHEPCRFCAARSLGLCRCRCLNCSASAARLPCDLRHTQNSTLDKKSVIRAQYWKPGGRLGPTALRPPVSRSLPYHTLLVQLLIFRLCL